MDSVLNKGLFFKVRKVTKINNINLMFIKNILKLKAKIKKETERRIIPFLFYGFLFLILCYLNSIKQRFKT